MENSNPEKNPQLSSAGLQKGMRFSKDDFSCNLENWNLLSQLISKNSPIAYLELGVFEGRSLFWVIEHLFHSENDIAVAVDRFPITEQRSTREIFFQNLEICPRKNQVQIMEMDFRSGLIQLAREKQKFDFIYEDGCHISSETMETLCLAWPLLKVNGFLVIDDYEWNRSLPSEFSNAFAIDAFLRMHRQELQLIRKDHQVVIKKIPTNRFDLDSLEIGEWVYRWPDGVLYHLQFGQELTLTPSEKQKIESIFTSPKWSEAKDRSEFEALMLKNIDLMTFLEQKKANFLKKSFFKD